jgi:hypothetical protein
MRKTLLLNNMSHKYGAGFLIPAYFVLGITLVPTLPEMGSVQNVTFNECHESCHVENGTEHCTRVCSGNSSVVTSTTGKSRAVVRGSTGPTHPPKPVGTQGNKH